MDSIYSYNYTFAANPPRRDGSDAPAGYHVRLEPNTHLRSKHVVAAIAGANNIYDEGISVGVLLKLEDVLGELLSDGHPVTIDGIGTFQLRLGGTVEEHHGKLQARDVSVTGILFTPAERLVALANRGVPRFKPRPDAPFRVSASPGEIARSAAVQRFLQDHFATHDRLTRQPLQDHLRLSKRRTLAVIEALIADGRLRREGHRATTCYRLVQ